MPNTEKTENFNHSKEKKNEKHPNRKDNLFKPHSGQECGNSKKPTAPMNNDKGSKNEHRFNPASGYREEDVNEEVNQYYGYVYEYCWLMFL